MEQTALFEFPFPDEEDAPDGPVQIGLAVTAALEKATAGDGSETRKSPASGGGAKAGG